MRRLAKSNRAVAWNTVLIVAGVVIVYVVLLLLLLQTFLVIWSSPLGFDFAVQVLVHGIIVLTVLLFIVLWYEE